MPSNKTPSRQSATRSKSLKCKECNRSLRHDTATLEFPARLPDRESKPADRSAVRQRDQHPGTIERRLEASSRGKTGIWCQNSLVRRNDWDVVPFSERTTGWTAKSKLHLLRCLRSKRKSTRQWLRCLLCERPLSFRSEPKLLISSSPSAKYKCFRLQGRSQLGHGPPCNKQRNRQDSTTT